MGLPRLLGCFDIGAGPVTIDFMNMSGVAHNVAIQQGTSGPTLKATPVTPSGTHSLTVNLKAGTYTFYCDVHAGMKGTVRVLSRYRTIPSAAADKRTLSKQLATDLTLAKGLESANLPANTVLVKYTVPGDINLDGTVNFLFGIPLFAVSIACDDGVGAHFVGRSLHAAVTSRPSARAFRVTHERERFDREARAVAALNHPNIVTLHSIEEADGVRFLTMEFVDGTTSALLLDLQGPLPRRQARGCALLAEAQQAAG